MTHAAAWKSKVELPSDVYHRAIGPRSGDAFFARRAPRKMPSVQLTLFGGIHLQIGDRELMLKNRKAKALIAYLAFTSGMKETRDRLIGLFWSESNETKARASLRQVLYVLRDTFDKAGFNGFSSDDFQVSLDSSRLTHDLGRALASIDQGHPIDCLVDLPHITDTLLAGFEDIDPSFSDWLDIQRESVRQRLIRALEAQLLVTSHAAANIKSIARALFQIDPTHELACQKLMRAYVETGDIAGALLVYKRLWTNLENDHDMEPSTATQDLVVAIKSGTYQSQINSAAKREPAATHKGCEYDIGATV